MYKENTTPKESLEFAAELYKEQTIALNRLSFESDRCDEDNLDDIHATQKRYDNYVRELATKPEIVNAIPDFARNKVGSQYFISVAWHVVYLSHNIAIFDELLTLAFSDGASWYDSNKTIHLLQDDEADVIIGYLKSKDIADHEQLKLVNKYIQNNRRENHLDLFIRDNKLRFPKKHYTEISYFNTPQCVNLIEEQITKEDNYIKYRDECLRLQLQKYWEPVALADCAEDCGLVYGKFGGPGDISSFTSNTFARFETLDEETDEDGDELYDWEIEEIKEGFFQSFEFSGNIQLIKCLMEWLINDFDNEDIELRVCTFITLCEFVKNEVKDTKSTCLALKEISNIYKQYLDLYNDRELCYSEEQVYAILAERLPEKFDSEHSKKLWREALPTIISSRDPKIRYGYSSNKPFDILKKLKSIRFVKDRKWITQFINELIIYTGQYFPFDRYAYFEKQEAQLDVWQQYLEENRDQFLPGRWVRWGKYLD